MIDIDQYIADFIRDAQYRIAEIGVEIDGIKNGRSPRLKELLDWRDDLYLFMDILYVGEWSIIDGYNHLTDWTDEMVQSEAEYLRNKTGMVTSPFTTFVGVYPEIVASIGGGSSSGLPQGDPLDFIQYNQNGEAVTQPFPQFVGAQTGDTPATYFA